MASFEGQYGGDAFNHEAVTVSTVAIGGTAATLAPTDGTRAAKAAVISVDTNPIRYRMDGQAAVTNTTGHYVAAGTTFTIFGGKNISNLRMIRDSTAGADATVRITYLR